LDKHNRDERLDKRNVFNPTLSILHLPLRQQQRNKINSLRKAYKTGKGKSKLYEYSTQKKKEL